MNIKSITTNTIVSDLTAIPTFTEFKSVAYYKEGGTWKVFEPYVKQDGVWTTNFYIYKILAPYDVQTSAIARGIPVGDELEYTDEVTLGRSILKRVPYENSIVNK